MSPLANVFVPKDRTSLKVVGAHATVHTYRLQAGEGLKNAFTSVSQLKPSRQCGSVSYSKWRVRAQLKADVPLSTDLGGSLASTRQPTYVWPFPDTEGIPCRIKVGPRAMPLSHKAMMSGAVQQCHDDPEDEQ